MRIYILMLGILLPPMVMAKEGGVMEANGSVDINYADSNHYTNGIVGAGYRMPVGDYGGVVFVASASDSNSKGYPYLDTTGQGVGIEALLRKYDLGLVAVQYTHGEMRVAPPSGAITETFNSYGILGVYYAGSVDAMLGYSRMEYDTVANSDTFRVAGRLYLNDNLATELTVRRRDSTDGYGISFTYQPVMFANDIGLTASYESDDVEDSVSVSIKYYFGTKVSLIDRNRKY